MGIIYHISGSGALFLNPVGDNLHIYLEAAPDSWYYFTYARGFMKAYSSLDAFNAAISEIDPKKRQQKGETKDLGLYTFTNSTKRERDNFRKRFDK